MKQTQYDVIVIGAGAAGLMCAATAGYRGKSVLVIDHAPKAAAKIRISGGGKCNFTNLTVTPDNFICENPHFVKSALARYGAQDFIDLVDRHGLAYEERDLGKLFCLHRASDLIQILRTECDWAQVQFALKARVLSVIHDAVEGYQLLANVTEEDQPVKLHSPKLIVATGALSFPKLKATGFGYALAEQFGLKIIPPRPGLVPLVFEGKWRAFCAQMAGVSFVAKLSVGNRSFTEAILFTHQGISGPGTLQISNYWQKGVSLEINLLPTLSVLYWLKQKRHANESLAKALTAYFPKKFVQQWLEISKLSDELANQSDEQLQAIEVALTQWRLYPADTAGYDKAEVTLGGVDTSGISSKTMESEQPGLYFVGEVLDVTGHLGGYNFQWAWASGVACGQSV